MSGRLGKHRSTKPTPDFFHSGSRADLEVWKTELAPHYDTVLKMLGATENSQLTSAVHIIKDLVAAMAPNSQRYICVKSAFGAPLRLLNHIVVNDHAIRKSYPSRNEYLTFHPIVGPVATRNRGCVRK